MSDNFSPEADDQMPEKKSSQQLLLLLLLLLILVFAYLYFFTGLIRPRPENQPAAPKSASETPIVKKPLPPRPAAKGGEPATHETKSAAPAQGPKAPETAAKEGKAAQPAAAAKTAPGAKPAAPAGETKAAKPAAAEVKPAKPAAETKTAKPAAAEAKAAKPVAAAQQAKAEKPSAPAPKGAVKPETAAKEAKPAAAGEKKPAAKAAAEVKKVQKPEVEKTAAAQPKKVKVAAKPAAPAYALEINSDLAESEMGIVATKLKQAGIGHVVKSKSQKGEKVHRLFLADFGNKDEALEELERLRLAAPSAFMLKENGRYAVYGGSYLREAKATAEQDRLFDKGVKLVLKNATAPVSVVKVRAGSFADKASAEKAAERLKTGGLPATIVKVAK